MGPHTGGRALFRVRGGRPTPKILGPPSLPLFLYTDGVNEAMNAEGDVYSNEAMFRALASSPSREPARVLRHMLDDVAVHVSGNIASDDMTILCLRYLGKKPVHPETAPRNAAPFHPNAVPDMTVVH